MEEWIEAGKIAREAREFGKTLIKENVKVIDVAEQIENRILELGGKPAFPVGLSVNSMAAHDSPLLNDSRVFRKGDLVKLDMGAHVNGKIADTACTIEVGSNENKRLIEASENALKNAIKAVSPNIYVSELGRVIQETITAYGFSPVRNLSGHLIKEYVVHAGLSIPNFDNNDNHKLEEDMIIAIEPFATLGNGIVTEGKGSGIYRLMKVKNTRNMNARKVIEFIDKEFKTLPFSIRWLKFPQINFIMNILEKEGIVYQYPQLPEASNGLVSQFEHTIIVKEKPIVTTL